VSTGVAIVVAGAALALAYYLNRKSEAATVATVRRIQAQKAGQGLGAGDIVAIAATAGATYLGGPVVGAKVFGATGERL
jgi:hypothetical protein